VWGGANGTTGEWVTGNRDTTPDGNKKNGLTRRGGPARVVSWGGTNEAE